MEIGDPEVWAPTTLSDWKYTERVIEDSEEGFYVGEVNSYGKRNGFGIYVFKEGKWIWEYYWVNNKCAGLGRSIGTDYEDVNLAPIVSHY